GEWAAAVDLDGTLGARAAEEAGVVLERFAVVRRVPPTRWAIVVAALLDGVSLVIADVPRGVSLGDARRLIARARERDAILVAQAAEAAADARAFEPVVRAVEQLAPRIVLERPGRLSFPTRGPSRYFGGDDALAARVLETVREAGGDDPRVGIADGALAAAL